MDRQQAASSKMLKKVKVLPNKLQRHKVYFEKQWKKSMSMATRKAGFVRMDAFSDKSVPASKRQDYFGQHLCAGLASAGLFQVLCENSGIDTSPCWLPFFVSIGLGMSFTMLADYEFKRFHTFQEAEQKQFNVVITGGTRGIGKALAREFLNKGDNVFITSRSKEGVMDSRKSLAKQSNVPLSSIRGWHCDVSNINEVKTLVSKAQKEMGHVDIWINNAGFSGSFKYFLDSDIKDIETVVRTNLLGAMHGTHVALQAFKEQESGGHVFNMDGAGYDGAATPQYAAYGSTKAAITQLNKSLDREISTFKKKNVGVHTLSPGMVLTDLLLEGSTVQNRAKFNILCEQPETVAEELVPRMRIVTYRGESGNIIRYLTVSRAMSYILHWWERSGRFFDEVGNPKYLGEGERLSLKKELLSIESDMAKQGRELLNAFRMTQKERQLTGRLALMYSMCFVGVYIMLSVSSASAVS